MTSGYLQTRYAADFSPFPVLILLFLPPPHDVLLPLSEIPAGFHFHTHKGNNDCCIPASPLSLLLSPYAFSPVLQAKIILLPDTGSEAADLFAAGSPGAFHSPGALPPSPCGFRPPECEGSAVFFSLHSSCPPLYPMYMREVKVYSCGFEKFLSLQVYRLFRIGITGKFWGQMQLVRVTSAPYLEPSISRQPQLCIFYCSSLPAALSSPISRIICAITSSSSSSSSEISEIDFPFTSFF